MYEDYDFDMAEWQAESMLDAIWSNDEKTWKKAEKKETDDKKKDWDALYPDDFILPF